MKQKILQKVENNSGGRQVHKFLISEVYRLYKNKGLSPEIEYELSNGNIADIYVKDKTGVIVIECLVRPTITLVKKKVKKYKPVCDKLIFAYPSNYITKFPIDMFSECLKIEIPIDIRPRITGINLNEVTYTRAKVKSKLSGKTLKEYIGSLIDNDTKALNITGTVIENRRKKE